MAHDHGNDLPVNYPYETMVLSLVDPQSRIQLHEIAEKRSLLNEIGHPAVVSAMQRMGGGLEAGFADMGAAFYEAATDAPFVGKDISGTPTYRNPETREAAILTAYSVECYDSIEVLKIANESIVIMSEDAPMLYELIEESAVRALDNTLSNRELRSVKAGAALMRTLNITGQFRLDGGNFLGA